MTDWIGWAATAVFLGSYACKDQKRLRLVQAAAALLWALYGVIIGATPIIVANLLVAAAAAYSTLARATPRERPAGASRTAITPATDPDLSRIS